MLGWRDSWLSPREHHFERCLQLAGGKLELLLLGKEALNTVTAGTQVLLLSPCRVQCMRVQYDVTSSSQHGSSLSVE